MTQQEPSAEQLRNAVQVRQIFEAYVVAGFTEDQAIQLLVALFTGAGRGVTGGSS